MALTSSSVQIGPLCLVGVRLRAEQSENVWIKEVSVTDDKWSVSQWIFPPLSTTLHAIKDCRYIIYLFPRFARESLSSELHVKSKQGVERDSKLIVHWNEVQRSEVAWDVETVQLGQSYFILWASLYHLHQHCCHSFAQSHLTLQPHSPQQARFPRPTLSPRVCLNSCPLSQCAIQPSHPLPPPFPSSLYLSQLQGTIYSEVAQSCPTLCDPMDCSLSGSSVHGIFQAIVLEWIAISFSRGSSQPRDRTRVSRIVDTCFTVWATRTIATSKVSPIFHGTNY